MTEENKINIWIRIGDFNPMPLSIEQKDEPSYRAAEEMVNSL